MRRLRSSDLYRFDASTYNPTPKIPQRSCCSKQLLKPLGTTSVALATTHKRTFKFGVEVPKKWKDIIIIDSASGNTLWQDAVKKEVAALIFHKCFDFKSPNYKPSSEYQFCRLHLVHDIKPYMNYKARLVCDGSRVDPRELSTCATVVKGVSVRLLDLIAKSKDLQVLCGDIENVFIQAKPKEKIYTRRGPEFGDHEHSIAIIVRALYGLTTSAERFRTMLADYLRTIEFIPSRFDRDVWMRMRDTNDGYDYICTHVDDFKVVAKNPNMWVDRTASVFLVKEHGPHNYYLGNDYTYHDTEDMCTYGCKTYATDAVAHVERLFVCLTKLSTPIPIGDCHPELDIKPLLDFDYHHNFQMLLRMLQWMVTIGKPELCQLVSSLNRFGACLRQGHLYLAVRSF